MNIPKGLRIKVIQELIEYLKDKIEERGAGHIHTTIIVLEDVLYSIKGDGLDDK